MKTTNKPFVTPWMMLLKYSDVGKRRAVQIGKKKFISSCDNSDSTVKTVSDFIGTDWRPVRPAKQLFGDLCACVFFWGGVLALATVAVIFFLDSDMAVGEDWGWMLSLWVVLTLFIGLGGAAGGNGGGDND